MAAATGTMAAAVEAMTERVTAAKVAAKVAVARGNGDSDSSPIKTDYLQKSDGIGNSES